MAKHSSRNDGDILHINGGEKPFDPDRSPIELATGIWFTNRDRTKPYEPDPFSEVKQPEYRTGSIRSPPLDLETISSVLFNKDGVAYLEMMVLPPYTSKGTNAEPRALS